MSAVAAIGRRRVRFWAVNAAELLERLVSYGLAREVASRPGIARSVSVNQIEVAIAADSAERSLRARWRERVGTSGLAYLLVTDDADRRGSVQVLGPSTVDVPVRSVECARLADVLEEVPSMTSLDAVRHVAGEVDRLAGRGMVVEGLLSRHTLEDRFGNDAERWRAAAAAVEPLRISDDWRSVLVGVGYEVERLPQRGWLARHDGRPVAVVHPRAKPQDFVRLDEAGRPAEGVLAADCHRYGARYGILASRNRYRLFDCDPSATTAEWLDLDAPAPDRPRVRSRRALPADRLGGGVEDGSGVHPRGAQRGGDVHSGWTVSGRAPAVGPTIAERTTTRHLSRGGRRLRRTRRRAGHSRATRPRCCQERLGRPGNRSHRSRATDRRCRRLLRPQQSRSPGTPPPDRR